MSEPQGKGRKDWLSIASMLVTLVFGTLLTGWLKVVEEKVDEAKLSIDRYGATSKYIELLGDGSSPIYLKSMALASMLQFRLMEPDLLFSTGYMAEDHQGPGVLLQLLYQYAKDPNLMETPLGYVDLPGKLTGDVYEVSGWALAKDGLREIEVRLDGALLDKPPEYGMDRNDIRSLFTHYPSALKSGFRFEIGAEGLQGQVKHLSVRLIGEDFRFMQILFTDVCFSDQGVARALLDDSCKPKEDEARPSPK